MHQTIYGSLHLNESLKVNSDNLNGDYQPICAYTAYNTLFSIGAQFEGQKILDGFLIKKMRLKMYCFMGAITIGLVENKALFVEDLNSDDSNHKNEHQLNVKIKALHTNAIINWDDQMEHRESIFPNEGYVLKDNHILRTNISIDPHLIPDESKSAQDYTFIDDYLYIRDGDKIINKQKLIDDNSLLKPNVIKQIFPSLNQEQYSMLHHANAFTNYFLKGRDSNCHLRDVKIKID